jgi:hypothetical protein
MYHVGNMILMGLTFLLLQFYIMRKLVQCGKYFRSHAVPPYTSFTVLLFVIKTESPNAPVYATILEISFSLAFLETVLFSYPVLIQFVYIYLLVQSEIFLEISMFAMVQRLGPQPAVFLLKMSADSDMEGS